MRHITYVVDLDLRAYFDTVRHSIRPGKGGTSGARCQGFVASPIAAEGVGEVECPPQAG